MTNKKQEQLAEVMETARSETLGRLEDKLNAGLLVLKHPMGFWLQPNDYAVVIKKDEWEKSMKDGGDRNGENI